MHNAQRIGSYFGRILLAFYFLWNGLEQILHWSTYERNFTTDIMNWHVYVSKIGWLENAAEALLPLGAQLLALGIFVQVVAGIMLLISWHPRVAASILSLYVVVTNLFCHYFWMVEGFHREILLNFFMLNLALIGGLTLIVVQRREAVREDHYAAIQTALADHDGE